jgi:hypothetical protein
VAAIGGFAVRESEMQFIACTTESMMKVISSFLTTAVVLIKLEEAADLLVKATRGVPCRTNCATVLCHGLYFIKSIGVIGEVILEL